MLALLGFEDALELTLEREGRDGEEPLQSALLDLETETDGEKEREREKHREQPHPEVLNQSALGEARLF